MINWKIGKIFQILFIVLSLGAMNVFSVQEEVFAQSPSTNPLTAEINQRDPLVPDGFGKRELSSFEKYRLKKEIAKLDQRAKAELASNDGDKAFKLWYRQLKLARAIDPKTEINALGEIGAIAWEENRGQDVRNIAERLATIQDELKSEKSSNRLNSPTKSSHSPANSLPPELLASFAIAYQQLRYLDQAIAIYQQTLVNSRKADNLAAEEKNLETLGELHLGRFDYVSAAKVYKELLSLADSVAESVKGSKKTEFYLQSLADIYGRTDQIPQAIATKKRLIRQLLANQKTSQIPALEIAIAQDHETLKQTQQAIDAYNGAFKLAAQTEQLAVATDALTRLGKLYQKTNKIEQAIATYSKLTEIQQQSYDYYGLIQTYDILGEIHLQLNQNIQAKQYFELGLKSAKSLNYKIEYFDDQIEAIK